jgi:hypothetical protein
VGIPVGVRVFHPGKVPGVRLMLCVWLGVIVLGVVVYAFVGLDHR